VTTGSASPGLPSGMLPHPGTPAALGAVEASGARGADIATAGPVREPVFLLAPARSYSTISLALLAGHPEIYGFPEMLLFTAPTVGDLLDGTGRQAPEFMIRSGIIGVARAVAQLHYESQSAAAIRRAVRWLRDRRGWPTVALMNYLLGLVYPKTGLEKSPDTAFSTQRLSACLREYPQAKYLHLTRHPVTTQKSMLRQIEIRPPADMSPQALLRWCLYEWYSSHLRIAQVLEDLPVDQWMRVRAEDLLREPRVWLPRVLDWLGLAHDELTVGRMMRTEEWEFAPRHAGQPFGGGDPKFMRDPALRPVAAPSAEITPSSWDIPGDIRHRIIALARYLGY
jgi:hypothetical protein